MMIKTYAKQQTENKKQDSVLRFCHPRENVKNFFFSLMIHQEFMNIFFFAIEYFLLWSVSVVFILFVWYLCYRGVDIGACITQKYTNTLITKNPQKKDGFWHICGRHMFYVSIHLSMFVCICGCWYKNNMLEKNEQKKIFVSTIKWKIFE